MAPDGERTAAFRGKHPAYEAEWRRKNPGYAKLNRQKNYLGFLLSRAKTRAKSNGREFAITLADLEPLKVSHCPVLGIELKYGTADGNDDASASLDRIDNSRGYVPGNVLIVSKRANTLKRDATVDEMRKLAAFYGGSPQTLEGLSIMS